MHYSRTANSQHLVNNTSMNPLLFQRIAQISNFFQVKTENKFLTCEETFGSLKHSIWMCPYMEGTQMTKRTIFSHMLGSLLKNPQKLLLKKMKNINNLYKEISPNS